MTDLLRTDTEPAPSAAWRTVTATGSFVPDEQAYVRLRQYQGSNAKEVVVPFVLPDGTRILVDRGYISDTELANGRLGSDATIIGASRLATEAARRAVLAGGY